jgi:DNA-binding winged helix-turn-helix (wHTH) protein/Tol biopolymer transport system component
LGDTHTTAPTGPRSERFVFGDFHLDVHSRQLFRNHVHVPISAKTAETLYALVRRQGEIATKDELISEVWPDVFVSEDSLTQNISSLRRLLEDDSSHPRFIATIARRGYRFIAPVTVEDAVPLKDSSRPPAVVADDTAMEVAAAAPKAVIPAVLTGSSANQPSRMRWILAGALLLLGGIAVGLFLAMFRSTEVPEERRLRFIPELPPESTLASGGVVSPDGRHIAFIARDRQSGETRLWIRTLSTGSTFAIAESNGALRPFWAPDSRSIGFFGGNRLRRTALTGGGPTLICDTVQPRPSGGTWNERGEILYGDARALFVIGVNGGDPRSVLTPSAALNEISIGWPQFLPGGRRFLYSVTSTDKARTGTYVGSLDEDLQVKLLDVTGPQVAYTRGYLVYVREGRLFARAFDQAGAQFIGEPFLVVDDTAPNATVSAATDAVIAFGGGPSEELIQFNRQGRIVNTISGAPPIRNLSVSADQRMLIGEAMNPDPDGVWQIDLTRQVSTRLIPDGSYPLWLADGQTVAFAAAREPGPIGLYLRNLESGADQLLLRTAGRPIVSDASADSQLIAYTMVANAQTRQDIWMVSRSEPSRPSIVISSAAREIHPEISPDGRWIAYASDEEGSQFEVYVDAFPALGHKKRVSTNGGAQPQWRGDGRELFYLSGDQTLMSVGIAGARGLELTTPRRLFRPMLVGLITDFRNQYTVSPDGETFFVGVASQANTREPITLIVNWRGSIE